MASRTRLNKVIELLENGQVVFSGAVILCEDLSDVTFVADSDFDCCILETEHQGFDFARLRDALQYFLNRKRLAESGTLQAPVAPFVRIPANARELRANQWIVKQALDAGVYGLVIPHLNTVEEAEAAVVAARYPQITGVDDFEPAGQRGWWSRTAPRYWGLTPQEYYDRADLWPLDPDGEILLVGLIEEIEGVDNLRDILRNVKGMGAIWVGAGDLSMSLGKGVNSSDPAVQEALLDVLAICQEFDVPCAIAASPTDVEQRIEQGYRIIMAETTRTAATLVEGRRIAGR